MQHSAAKNKFEITHAAQFGFLPIFQKREAISSALETKRYQRFVASSNSMKSRIKVSAVFYAGGLERRLLRKMHVEMIAFVSRL